MPQQFLIANFQTALDNSLEPWLTPQDAMAEVNNYQVFRGVIQARPGIQYFAEGGEDNKPNEQSRLYKTVTGEDVADTKTITGNLANPSIRPGSITFTDPGGGGQTVTDDGSGNLTGDVDGAGNNTIDYQTGAYDLTWAATPVGNVTVAYTGADDNPVMGLMDWLNATQVMRLIGATTRVFNVLNTSTNRFDPIPFGSSSNAAAPTGDDFNFWSWTNYPDKNGAPRLIMVNNKASDNVYFYDGTDIKLFNDSGANDNPDYADPPSSSGGDLDSALHVFYFGERLVFIRPILDGTTYYNRIIWTGIRNSAGRGDKMDVASSGFLDLNTDSWIVAATRVRDKLVIWTTDSVFTLSISTDIRLPFLAQQVGAAEARGAQSPFSAVTWFGNGAAIGSQGIIGTDGRDTFRIDDKVPFFARDRMTGSTAASTTSPYNYIYGSTLFAYDQFWWLYPDSNDDTDRSSRILARNFVEENWTTYDKALTVLGHTRRVSEVLWDEVDGTRKDAWAQWDTTFDIWDSFTSQSHAIFTVAGNEHGFVYYVNGTVDESCEITGITQGTSAGSTTDITTEIDVFEVGDRILINNVTGLQESGESVINGLEFVVEAVSSNVITINLDSSNATSYTSGGTITKIFSREFKTKPLNPFVEENKKFRLKRLHFFIDTDKTSMKLDLFADRRQLPYRTAIPIDDGTGEGGAIKKWTSISVNQVANFHTLRIYSDTGPANERLHAIMLEGEPVGRLYR